ncbi:P-loop NTPase fold protein [Sinorhizobium americanum]|uniref:KAP-like P-loop domain-containing protein n=1 Tax=Sinorhizobium americanum TaxID=194963 RepID=A0A4R2BLM7_9HYPH|nr:P-loop NTPase fold protein [Sinorhizobium americanum]TCN26934.1 KAP-like P-loop domain-containing protein [Sinorhizobium americanum]
MQPAPKWSKLASDVAQLFGFSTPRSPSLIKAIERGVRYVAVDNDAQQIVFDAKALVIGLLAAGETERDSIRWGNTASWFYDWFARQKPQGQYRQVIDDAKTDPDLIFPAYDAGFKVILADEVSVLLPLAINVSISLSGRQEFEARHFFTAMLESGLLAEQLERIFGFSIANVEYDLKRNLISRMLTQPDTGETLDKWLAAFSLPQEAKEWFTSTVGATDNDADSEVDQLLDEFLRRNEVGKVSNLARTILIEAVKRNQSEGRPAEISSTRLFLACLAVGRSRPAGTQPIDLLAALAALSGDKRFDVIARIEQNYPKSTAPSPEAIEATPNVLKVLQAARIPPLSLNESNEITGDALICALLTRLETKIEDRLASESVSLEFLRTALVATLRPYDPSWARWTTAMQLSTSGVERFPDPPPIALAGMISFATIGNDNPDSGTLDDRLGALDEARAFARIAAARSISPPLAFAIFGEWGSGKSYFMRLMHDHVDKISRKIADEARSGSAFHENIVQIRFNAWHYADSNLWASLVDTIFVELDRWSRAREATLPAETLLDKLVTARELSLEAAEHLVHQRQQQKLAAERLVAAQRELQLKQETVSITPLVFWDVVKAKFTATVTPEKLKQATDQLGITELADNIEALKSTLDSVRNDATRTRLLARGLLRRLTSSCSIAWLFLAIVIVPVVAAQLYGLLTFDDRFAELRVFVHEWMVGLAGLVGATTVIIKKMQGQVRTGLTILEGYRSELEAAIDSQLKEPAENVKEAEDALAKLTSEVAEAKAALAASSDRLALAVKAYEADTGRDRLLRFVRDRAGADGYSKHLGLIANIRKDFTQLSVLMAAVDARLRDDNETHYHDYQRRVLALAEDAKDLLTTEERDRLKKLASPSRPSQAQSFDRIILYIDDLDRCPPEQVVQVLQAVHLLLSFPLFVVVVAVDSRWVSKSLETHYAALLSEGGKDFGGASANDYLEKIFQIPYWVRPLTKDTSVAFLSSLAAHAASNPPGAELHSAPQAADRRVEPQESGGQLPAAAHSGAIPTTDEVAPTVPNLLKDNPVATNSQPLSEARALVLTDRERSFMTALAPWVGDTPRRSLRFLNIYRVIKASLDDRGIQRLEAGGYRSLMTELALVVGSKKQEGLMLIHELASGAPVKDILERTGAQAISAMAKGALEAFNKAHEADDNGDLVFYSEIARRFCFDRHSLKQVTPGNPIIDQLAGSK